MTKYRCRDCNYSFDSEKIPEKCPYCGRKNVSKELNAEEILKEIS
jgi:rubrerythrin